MKHQPLLDRILVLRDPAPKFKLIGKSSNDMYEIPEDQRESFRPFTGKVVAIGPGQWVNGTFCPIGADLVVGAQVLFASMGSTTVDHDGVEHLLMRESDALSVLSN